MKTINEYVEDQKELYRKLSRSRQQTLVRKAKREIEEYPACADHSGFWRGLSARQVYGLGVTRRD